jgi:hypothetical protein
MQSTKQENYMRTYRSLMNGLFVCGVALTMASTLAAQTVTQVKAKVVRIKGYARFTTGNNVWQPLKVGETIRPGTVIQTGVERGSFVDLVLGDGSGAAPVAGSIAAPEATTSKISYQPSAEQNMVRIWENSLLGIDKLTSMDTGADVVSETQLDLKAGRIFGSVKKMSAASKYEVKIPNGIAGIRGTIYEITAEGVVRVASGLVVLAWVGPDGTTITTQDIGAGYEYDARSQKLSPLPPTEGDRMIRLPRGALAAEAPGFMRIRDHTLYRERVSPTENDQGEDNDNQQ